MYLVLLAPPHRRPSLPPVCTSLARSTSLIMAVAAPGTDVLLKADTTNISRRYSPRAGIREVQEHWRIYLMALSAGTGGLAFGWDTALISGVLQFQSFQRSFGLDKASADGPATLATLQSNIVSVLVGGCFFGAATGLFLPDLIGRRTCLLIAAVVFLVGSIIQTTCALNGQTRDMALAQLYVGRIIGGLGVGLSSATCATYISECSPKSIRGRLGGMYQLMIVTGICVAFFVNCECLSLSSLPHSR